MKHSFGKIILSPAFIFLVACTNGNNDAQLKDPSTVHPPSEAITDSTKLVNDSVIVPDTQSKVNARAGTRDSVQRR
jgi:hypothetical protein